MPLSARPQRGASRGQPTRSPQPGSAPHTARPAGGSRRAAATARRRRGERPKGHSPARKGVADAPRAPAPPPAAPRPAPLPRVPHRAALLQPCRRGAARGAVHAIPRSRGGTLPPQPWSPPPAEPECARRVPLPVFSPAGEEEGGVRAGGGGRARGGRAPLTAALAPPPTLKRPRRARHSGAPWRRRREAAPGPRARGSRDFPLGSAAGPGVPSPAAGFTAGLFSSA